jgi:hypothetical protein
MPSKQHKQLNNFWKNSLLALLIFQIVVIFSIGIYTLVDFPGILGQFGIKFQPDMGILQLIMAYNSFLSASICAWCVFWVTKNNLAGIQAGTTIGVLLFVVSFSVFIKFGRVDILLFDSIRAFLMVVCGFLAYKENKKIPNSAFSI